MGQFNGKRVYGAPISRNFLQTIRPNLNGECPSGWLACNPDSQPDNIICMEEQDPSLGRTLEERCPIVELMIAKKSDYPNWRSEVWSDS